MALRLSRPALLLVLCMFNALAEPKSRIVPHECVTVLRTQLDKNGRIHTGQKRKMEEMQELRLLTYNLLNWDSYGELYQGPHGPRQRPFNPKENKPMDQRIGVAKKILETNPDIVMIQELRATVKDPAEFHNDAQWATYQLTEDFLGGQYDSIVLPSNDPRGLHVAFLVKKDLPLFFETRSFKDRNWVDPVRETNPNQEATPVLSRDAPALIVRTEKDAPPKLIILNTHMKSKRDRPGDPESRIWAKAQAEEIAKIMKELRNEFPGTPIMLSGDSNGDFANGAEFAPLRDLGKRSSQEMDKDKETADEKWTHIYFPPGGGAAHQGEIDLHLLSPEFGPHIIDSDTQPYYYDDGSPVATPTTFHERNQLQPSDHRPVLLRLNGSILR